MTDVRFKRSVLRQVAIELNEVLGLEPPIDYGAPVPELIKQIKEAILLIDPVDDEFTDPTQTVLDQLMQESQEEKPQEVVETQEEKPQEEEIQEVEETQEEKPQEAQKKKIKKRKESYIAEIDKFIESTDKPFTIEDVTKQVGCSKAYIYSYFPALVKVGVLVKSKEGRTAVFQKSE